MFHLRPYIIVVLLSCSMSVFSQSHDFEIRDFHENLTDLTAATSEILDLRKMKPALIRFAVRDTLFSFRANNGILKLKKGVGEILLFVPDGTKRITISHPQLGTLRDYELPLAIKTRMTYDAEIVITNDEYMRNKYGYEQRPVQEEDIIGDLTESTIIAEQPIWNEESSQKDVPTAKPAKNRKPIKTSFLLGGGYQVLGVVGPTALIGLEIGSFLISADYTHGLEKVEGVAIFYDDSFGESYDYSVSRVSARLGINTSPNSALQIVPQVGASINMIKGDLIRKSFMNTQFSSSTPISLSVAINIRVRLIKPLYLFATPQYDFAVGADDVYKVIKDADSKIKGWGEGFCVSAGLLLRF